MNKNSERDLQSQQFGESRQGVREYFLDLIAPQISKITNGK